MTDFKRYQLIVLVYFMLPKKLVKLLLFFKWHALSNIGDLLLFYPFLPRMNLEFSAAYTLP